MAAMRDMLAVIVSLAALAALLSLYEQQRSAQSAPAAVPESQLTHLRQRLAEAESAMERERARAATAETALQQLAGSRPRDGATALAALFFGEIPTRVACFGALLVTAGVFAAL